MVVKGVMFSSRPNGIPRTVCTNVGCMSGMSYGRIVHCGRNTNGGGIILISYNMGAGVVHYLLGQSIRIVHIP